MRSNPVDADHRLRGSTALLPAAVLLLLAVLLLAAGSTPTTNPAGRQPRNVA